MYRPYLNIVRPHQWLKNLLLIFPPFFAGKLFERNVLTAAPWAFIAFSLMASSNYIINDIVDCEADKEHITKRYRCIPRGDISVQSALRYAIILCILSFVVSFYFFQTFWLYLLIYLAISLSYTFYFKNVVILDIFFIAFGFLIRVLAGGVAFSIPISNWLFLTVFVVALFLAAGKRMGEIVLLNNDAGKHRKSLVYYTSSFLEGVLWFSASASLVTYALYVIENRRGMFYAVPLAAFGLLRFIYIVKDGKGDPTDALLKDGQIMLTGVLWLLFIGYFLYR
jgi:4-hydroxybenzoate polyprenyltransferase